MLNYIRALNKWYDHVEEPFRFLLLLLLVLPGLVLHWADLTEWGIVYFLIMLAIRVGVSRG